MVSWDPLHVWTKELTKTFPDLSRPQLKGLAEWSFGMVLSRCCSLDSVAFYLADWFDQSEFTVRSRLREWYLPAQYKSVSPSGDKRQELPVASCFAPLLNWVRRGWPQPRLALALDASTLANRFVLLAVSVLYRRCAVPVAWKVLPATAKGSWRPYWVQLLQAVRGVLPDNWTVLVLADRGLWARWLFNEVQLLGWHPLMRVNRGGCFRPEGSRKFVRFTKLVSKVGKSWKGHGTAFATPGHQIESTLLGWWGGEYKEQWLILSDLAAEEGKASWYGMRSWIEQGFKDSKRGGWQWQHTRMEDPERAERLWLAVAVATLWLLRVGGSVEAAKQQEPSTEEAKSRDLLCRGCWGKSSVFACGLRSIQMSLIKHTRLPLGQWVPEPWPE